jgi:hypothetical protein
MAITTEFLNSLFGGAEGGGEKVSKILSEYEADVIGLKRKNEELLGSIKSESAKRDALLKEKEALEAAARELNAKLEEGLPDKEKQYFQSEIEKWKTNAANTAAELAEREQKISALESDHHSYICQQEFERLLNADPSIIPELREPIKTLFFANKKFDWYELTDEHGKKEKKLLEVQTSRQMKDELADFLNAPAGQYFRMAKNSGGGAAGSNGPHAPAVNPWEKGKENLTEQGKIIRGNPALAAQLKAAAGVPA